MIRNQTTRERVEATFQWTDVPEQMLLAFDREETSDVILAANDAVAGKKSDASGFTMRVLSLILFITFPDLKKAVVPRNSTRIGL